MLNDITLNTNNPFLLASGEMRPWYKTWRIAWLIIPLVLAIIGGIVYHWLQKPIYLPSDRLVLIVGKPEQLQKALKDEWMERLPETWREVLVSKRRLPCVFGLARGEEQLLPYVSCSDMRPTEEDQAKLHWPQGEYTTLGSVLAQSWHTVTVDIDLGILAEIVQVSLPLHTDSMLRFHLKEGLFYANAQLESTPLTQQKAEKTGIQSPVSDADILLGFSKQTWDSIPAAPVNLFPGLPDLQRLKELPAIVQYELWLNASSTPSVRRIRFAEPISEADAAKVLMYFGVTERKKITLPDGSITTERVLPQPEPGKTLFQSWQNDRGEWIDMNAIGMTLSMASTTPEMGTVVSECSLLPWLRMKPGIVYELLRTLDWTNAPPPDSLPTVTFGSVKGQLSVCFE